MNWVLTLIMSVAGSIILSVVGNLLTDPVKNWISRRSLNTRKQRAETLQKELDEVVLLQKDKFLLSLRIYNKLALGIVLFLIGISGGLVGVAYLVVAGPANQFGAYNWNNNLAFISAIVCSIPAAAFIYQGMTNLFNIFRLTNRIENMESYVKSTKQTIGKLLNTG